MELGIPDAIGSTTRSVPEIVARVGGTPNKDALLRCLRLLAVAGVFTESSRDGVFAYALTDVGALFQTGAPKPGMACGAHHWIGQPMWESFAELTDYVAGLATAVPFEMAHKKPIYEFYKERGAYICGQRCLQVPQATSTCLAEAGWSAK